jgi:hypothetical protein
MQGAVTIVPPRPTEANAAIGLYHWPVQQNFHADAVSGLGAKTAQPGIEPRPEPHPFGG